MIATEKVLQPSQFCTIKEAATEMQISQAAVRAALLEERLPYIRLFGRKLIARQEIQHYLERTRPDGVKPRGRPRKSLVAPPSL